MVMHCMITATDARGNPCAVVILQLVVPGKPR